jgi:hypothetical protein
MSDYLHPFEVAFRPHRGARRLPQLTAWWRPYAVTGLVAMALAFLSHSLAVTFMVAHLPPSATPDDVVRIRQWLGEGLASRVALIPLRLAAESAITGLLLMGFAHAFVGRSVARFRGFFVLSLSAALIPLLFKGASLAWSSLAPGAGPTAIGIPFSAADLLPSFTDYRIILLLTSANLSTLWYVGSVATGLTVLCRCRAGKAILVAVAAWTVSTAFSIIVLLLLRNAYAFRL